MLEDAANNGNEAVLQQYKEVKQAVEAWHFHEEKA